MPPKRKIAASPPVFHVHHRVSAGAGMTAGLEIWSVTIAGHQRFVMVDKTSDGRFAADTTTWNTAAGLNEATTKILKDATQ